MKLDKAGRFGSGVVAAVCWLFYFVVVGMSLTQNRLDPTDLEIITVNFNVKVMLAIAGTLFLGLAWFTEEES